jgi:hypothetical protein
MFEEIANYSYATSATTSTASKAPPQAFSVDVRLTSVRFASGTMGPFPPKTAFKFVLSFVRYV